MRRLPLEELVSLLATPDYKLTDQSKLVKAEKPDPFVAPILETASDLSDPLSAEVVIVRAPAAVGKSVMARYISFRKNIPILNLADVPVGTHSLVGILQSEFVGNGDPVEAFHRGELPLIIDALDEGKLLTGKKSFDQFLATTGDLLLRDRHHPDRPKLLLFGRPESAEDADVGLFLWNSGIPTVKVEIGFFEEKSSRDLIHAYAESAASRDSAYHRFRKPAEEVVDALFDSIAIALDIEPGKLWDDEKGSAFAGYAPVLAAIGQLLAGMDNYQEVSSRLRSSKATEPWQVIEDVMNQILRRDQVKLIRLLRGRLGTSIPEGVYSPDEQLDILFRWLSGSQVSEGVRVHFTGANQSTYFGIVEQNLRDHAFVEVRQPRNAVLGAVVLAHGILSGYASDAKALLEEASRQPFLWRCFLSRVGAESMIDGDKLGYLSSSLWSDPATSRIKVEVAGGTQEGLAIVRVRFPEKVISFSAIMPLRLYGLVRRVAVDLPGELILEGSSLRRGRSVLTFDGRSEIECARLRVDADEVVVRGHLWLNGAEVQESRRLGLHIDEDAVFGWGEMLRSRYPWSHHPGELDLVNFPESKSVLAELIEAFKKRVGDSPKPISLMEDFSPPSEEYGMRTNWMRRAFGEEFPVFIGTLIEHGLAKAEKRAVHGASRLRLTFEVSWDELLDAACRRGQVDPRLASFVRDFEKSIG